MAIDLHLRSVLSELDIINLNMITFLLCRRNRKAVATGFCDTSNKRSDETVYMLQFVNLSRQSSVLFKHENWFF